MYLSVMDTMTTPAPVIAPRTRHKGRKAAARNGKRRGAPCKYPWHTLEVGQSYYIPCDSDVEFDSVLHAVYRQNRIGLEKGLAARFRLPDTRVPNPDRPGAMCWILQRYA
jgi:hypothetical protein